MLGLAGYDWAYDLPFWVYLLPTAAYALAIGYGSYSIQSNFFLKAYCAGSTTKKQIALSFDDGPATNYTPQILAILKAHEVEAVFFCIGNRVVGHETLLRQMHQEGHLIGNHSFSHHFWFDLYNTAKMKDDLQQMNQVTQAATGLQPRLFRPPYGVTNPNLRRAIEAGNFVSVGWNVRSMDTVTKDPQKLLRRVSKAIRPGAIVLFHDTSHATVSMLSAFIKHATDNGYEIVRLDKMLQINAYV